MKNTSIYSVPGMVGMILITMFLISCEASATNTADELFTDNSTPLIRTSDSVNKDICTCFSANFVKENLNETERTALLYMREEEKLARDVYVFLYGKWKHSTFENIKEAEGRHMEAVRCLLDKYDLKDPVGEDVYGKFENKQLADMYDALTADGAVSLEKALAVGAAIEDVDIFDLQKYLMDTKVDNADIKAVFENLMRASRNHLRAFNGALNKVGVVYTPKYLDQTSYDAIVNGDMEKGNGNCAGGQGGGNKNCSKDKCRQNKQCTGKGQGKGSCNSPCTSGNPGGNGKGKGKCN